MSKYENFSNKCHSVGVGITKILGLDPPGGGDNGDMPEC